MQLAGMPDQAAVRLEGGAPAWMPRRMRVGACGDLDAERRGDDARRLDSVRPRRGAAAPPPAPAFAPAGDSDGQMRRLVGKRRLQLRELLSTRPRLHRQTNGWTRLGHASEHRSDLVQADIAEAAADVARQRAEQT